MGLTTLGLSAPEKPERVWFPSRNAMYWIMAFAVTVATATAPGVSWFWWGFATLAELICMFVGLPPLVGMFIIWPAFLTILTRVVLGYVSKRMYRRGFY